MAAPRAGGLLLLGLAALEVLELARAGQADKAEQTCADTPAATPGSGASSCALLARSKVVRESDVREQDPSEQSLADLSRDVDAAAEGKEAQAAQEGAKEEDPPMQSLADFFVSTGAAGEEAQVAEEGTEEEEEEDPRKPRLADISRSLAAAEAQAVEEAARRAEVDAAMGEHSRHYVQALETEIAEATRADGAPGARRMAHGAPHEEIFDPASVHPYIPYGTHHLVYLKCSQSCGRDSRTPCALILVLHGKGMDAGLMVWLTVGRDLSATGGFSETEMGPFCAAFLKSASDAWDGAQDGHDTKIAEAAIKFVESTRTLDQDRIYMHGYSSGAHMSWSVACGSLGSRLAAIVPYAGGLRWNTQCLWRQHVLTVHGTRDCVVPYDYGQDEPAASAGGSLGLHCSELPNATQSTPLRTELSPNAHNPTYAGTGTRLAFHVAVANGYSKDDPDLPPKTRSFDLADSDARNWDIPLYETDEFIYPVDPANSCGSSTLWRMNKWNHDYPNKRRGSLAGVAIFWVEMRRWLATRVRCQPKLERACMYTNEHTACGTPQWVSAFQAREGGASMSTQTCRLTCQYSKDCAEGWYLATHKMCFLYGFPWSPSACAERQSWGTQFGISVFKCDEWPAPTPLPSGAAPAPTPEPSSASDSFCNIGEVLQDEVAAGYTCSKGGDSNTGFTKLDCDKKHGHWQQYKCGTASQFWLMSGGNTWEHSSVMLQPWRRLCCVAGQ